MEENLLDNRSNNSGGNYQQSSVPNAGGTLALGIISIATCWLWGVPGVICGIIALVLHKKDKEVYLSDPERYDNSFKTSKAGFICGIIGLSISGLFLFLIIIQLIFVGSAAFATGGFR